MTMSVGVKSGDGAVSDAFGSDADWIMQDLFEPEEEDQDVELTEYDISSNPNDFNVVTLNSYIESDAIKIPGFQRNYVWDIKRASRWIESLLLGLPVPQLFLYEASRNSFLVIDGQQRLMTIYYFLHGRFPKPAARSTIRTLFDKHGKIPDEVFADNDLFQDFKLRLENNSDNRKSRFHGLTYAGLEEYRTTLDLRTVRSIMIKQNRPEDGDSSVFEIFNRLNTGGTNLKPQEIRACMFHSDFYIMLARINCIDQWRRFFGKQEPDLHMRDIEIILRAFAILEEGSRYSTTMSRFLNEYSRKSRNNEPKRNAYLEGLFSSFIEHCDELNDDAFLSKKTNKFNVALFEAVFYAVCSAPLAEESFVKKPVNGDALRTLEVDDQFVEASSARTTNSSNVKKRLERALDVFNVG